LIKPGAAVRLEHWGGDRPLAGLVRLVEPSGFTKLSALGVEEQRVNTVIDLVDPPDMRPTLGDNFRVDCRVTVWSHDDVLQIPTSALFRVDGEWTVFAVENDRAKETTVQIGHSNGRIAEVLDGLEINTPVIMHPGDSIRDEVPVQLR
jgi:HlyD family secretion protein